VARWFHRGSRDPIALEGRFSWHVTQQGWDMSRWLPSGKHTKTYGKWPFIVDLPIKSSGFPYLCKRLPEGRSYFVHWSNMHLVSWLFDCLCLFWDNSDESYPKLSPAMKIETQLWLKMDVYSSLFRKNRWIGRVQLPFLMISPKNRQSSPHFWPLGTPCNRKLDQLDPRTLWNFQAIHRAGCLGTIYFW